MVTTGVSDVTSGKPIVISNALMCIPISVSVPLVISDASAVISGAPIAIKVVSLAYP